MCRTGYLGDNATATGIAQITPPLQGRGRGWGLSALRKPVDPTPTPWSLSDQSGGLVPPRLKGRGLIFHHARTRHWNSVKRITHLSPESPTAPLRLCVQKIAQPPRKRQTDVSKKRENGAPEMIKMGTRNIGKSAPSYFNKGNKLIALITTHAPICGALWT